MGRVGVSRECGPKGVVAQGPEPGGVFLLTDIAPQMDGEPRRRCLSRSRRSDRIMDTQRICSVLLDRRIGFGDTHVGHVSQ